MSVCCRNEMAASASEEKVDIKHKVLVLGAGRVAAPLVEYLTRDPAVKLSAGKQH